MDQHLQATVDGMRKHGFEVIELETAAQAKEYLLGRIPAGSAVGHVPQATRLTRGAKRRLTRPSTPFCSWIIRGRRRSHAAASAGIVG